MTPAGALKAAARAGFNVISITDHNEMRGSLEARELSPNYGVDVIVGSEISTREGHLLALDIHKPIPSGLSLIETLLQIGDQNGFAIAPHLEAPGTQSINRRSLLSAMNHPDARLVLEGIEVYNAALPFRYQNHLNRKLAGQFPLAQVANSDSHVSWAVGSASTEFPGHTANDLRHALARRMTIAHGTPGFITLSPVCTWVFHTMIKRAGWVTSNLHPDSPLILQRHNPVETDGFRGSLPMTRSVGLWMKIYPSAMSADDQDVLAREGVLEEE